jgi:hypothetical protein
MLEFANRTYVAVVERLERRYARAQEEMKRAEAEQNGPLQPAACK